jgi:hypothetical protein
VLVSVGFDFHSLRGKTHDFTLDSPGSRGVEADSVSNHRSCGFLGLLVLTASAVAAFFSHPSNLQGEPPKVFFQAEQAFFVFLLRRSTAHHPLKKAFVG